MCVLLANTWSLSSTISTLYSRWKPPGNLAAQQYIQAVGDLRHADQLVVPVDGKQQVDLPFQWCVQVRQAGFRLAQSAGDVEALSCRSCACGEFADWGRCAGRVMMFLRWYPASPGGQYQGCSSGNALRADEKVMFVRCCEALRIAHWPVAATVRGDSAGENAGFVPATARP